MNFDENGEMDLNFALRMGVYRLHSMNFARSKLLSNALVGNLLDHLNFIETHRCLRRLNTLECH